MIEWVSLMSTCFLYVSLLLGGFIIAITLVIIALSFVSPVLRSPKPHWHSMSNVSISSHPSSTRRCVCMEMV